MKKNQNGSSVIEALLILVVLGLIGLVGWYVWQQKNSKTTAPTNASAAVNTWTGKGQDLKWSNATNWSKGTPRNGQQLVFDLTDLPKNSDGTAKSLNNDLNDVTLESVSFEGKEASGTVGFNITGNTLRLSKGIYDNLVENVPNLPLQMAVSTNIVFTDNATITVGPKAGILAVGQDKQSIDFGNHALSLTNTEDGRLSVVSAMSGTGHLTFSSSIKGYGFTDTSSASPNLHSEVTILNGTTLMRGSSLGDGKIIVAKGATLWVASSDLSATIQNPLTLSGSGTQSSGKASGALEICLGPSGDSGCNGTPQQLNLTGQVTLTGDTQLGVGGATVTISKLIDAKHSLTTVPGDSGKIVR